MTKDQLHTNEYNQYYHTYISKAGDIELIDGLIKNKLTVHSFLESIPEDTYDFAYAEGKWTIKEVIQHIIDTERIFSYRALAFARKDKVALPGYEQDDYAITSKANERTKKSLLLEYSALRLASIALFKSFSNEMLKEIGNASNSDMSVRAIGFILIGHENHHCQIIKERYL